MRKTISLKSILIAVLSALFFLCTICSVAVMTKKTNVQTAEAAEWTATSANGKVEIYQLAPNTGWLMNSYVIKTANGKLIVIDGGADGGAGDGGSGHGSSYTSVTYLPAALRAIAGVGANGYFEVEAWFITHAHKDHYLELAKMLTEYNASSNYKINNFYFDIPEYGSSAYPSGNGDYTNEYGLRFRSCFDNYAAVNGIATSGDYYDDLNGAVINAESIAKGLNITVDGVRFQILQTWALEDGGDVNSNSLVMKMYVGDTSFLWLADAASIAGARLISNYTTAELTSDYVQMAHHGQGGLTEAQYAAAGVTSSNTSQKYLWPTPLWVWSNWSEDNSSGYPIDEIYYQANGNRTMAANANNIVACKYTSYPAALNSYDNWASCIASQKIVSLDYEEVGFEVLGAQIRTQDPEGLRFVAQMTDAAATKYQNAKMGMIFVTEELDTTQWLKVSADGTTCTTNDKAIVVSPKKMWDDSVNSDYGIADGYTAFSCVLLGGTEAGSLIPEAMYNKPITAVGFIIPESGEIIYTDRVTRSIGYMATVERLQSGYTTNTIVEKFADAVASDIALSVNDGAIVTTKDLLTPKFTIAGQDVSAASNVTYTSSNESVIKVVGNKLQAVANGSATITATLSAGGSKTFTKTVEVETYVDQVTFDATNQKMQTAAGEDVTFSFDAKGYSFTVTDGTNAYDTSVYTYDETAKTLTFKGTYLDTLAIGVYPVQISVADKLNTTINARVGAYGDAEGEHLAFASEMRSVNDFELVPTNNIFYYLTTSSADPVYVDSSVSSAHVLPAGEGINGQSMRFTKTAAASSTNWTKLAYFNFGFKSGVTYNVSMKMRYTLPEGLSTGTLSLRFGESTNNGGAWSVNVSENSQNNTGWTTAASTWSYDATTKVLSVKAVITAPEDGTILNLTTIGVGIWTVIIDDICVTTTGETWKTAPEGSWMYTTFESSTFNGTFASTTGGTIAQTTSNVISGTQSLQITTSTAGEAANWNEVFNLTGSDWATTSHKITMKLRIVSFPTGMTSGSLNLRGGGAHANGLLLNVHTGGITNVSSSSSAGSTATYNSATGVYTLTAYIDNTNATNRSVTLATIGGGSWTLVVDEIAFFTL